MPLWGSKVNRRKRGLFKTAADGIVAMFNGTRRAVPWVLLLALLIGLPVILFKGWRQVVDSPLFHVKNIEVTGAEHVSQDELTLAMGVSLAETNIFTVDQERAARAIEAQVPWVKTAHVDRTLPDRLHITIEERTFGGLALLGGLWLVDEEGVPFKPLEHEQGMDRPVVTGLGDDPRLLGPMEHAMVVEALEIMTAYSQAGLGKHDRLAEVRIDKVTGYTLVTERDGVRVLMGEGDMNRRLARLGEVFAELSRRDMRVSEVRLDGERSLRYVAVKPVEARREGR